MAAEVGVWPSRRDFKASQRLLAETRARAAPPAPPLHAQPLVVATIPPGPPGGEDAAITNLWPVVRPSQGGIQGVVGSGHDSSSSAASSDDGEESDGSFETVADLPLHESAGGAADSVTVAAYGSADFSAASGGGGLLSGALADGVSGAPVRHEVTQSDLGSVRAPRSPGMFSVSSQMGIMKRALKRSASSTGAAAAKSVSPRRGPVSDSLLMPPPPVPPCSIAERARLARLAAADSVPAAAPVDSSSSTGGTDGQTLTLTAGQLKDLLSGVASSNSSGSELLALVEELRLGRLAGEHPSRPVVSAPPAPRSIPPNSLLPPDGFEFPPFGEFSDDPRPLPPLRRGSPLAELSASVAPHHVDLWASEYSSLSQELSPYLAGKGLAHWEKRTPPPDPLAESLPASSSAESSASQSTDPKTGGFPVTPACERVLQKVAYAPSLVRKSGWAQAVRVSDTDYRRCLSWNLLFAPHEAAPLCADRPATDRSRDVRSVVADACFRGEEEKKEFAARKETLELSVSSLKCGLAANAVAEGGAYVTADLVESFGALDGALNSFLSDAVDVGAASAELLTDPQYAQLRSSFDNIKSLLNRLDSRLGRYGPLYQGRH